MSTSRVVFLPGTVLPAELAYGGLLQALGPVVDALPLDLAVYDGESPSVDYSLDTEVKSITQAVDARGWGRFDLVGYSGGGSVALAFVARYP
ncbi:MAG TPA: alpha/beta hydrolase, partial [Actinomycetes bacterium]|nr:alpha/beta hydrolase [Actinomycetes bacterium]